MFGSPTPPPTPGIPPPIRGFEPGQPSGGAYGSVPEPGPGMYYEWRGFSDNYPDPSQPGQFNGFNPSGLIIPAQGTPYYTGNSYGDRRNNYAGVWQETRIPAPYASELDARTAQRNKATDEWMRIWGHNFTDDPSTWVAPNAPYYPYYGAPAYRDPANDESARRHAASLYGKGMPLGDPMGRFSDALAQQRMDAAKKAGIRQRNHWYGNGQMAGRRASGQAAVRGR